MTAQPRSSVTMDVRGALREAIAELREADVPSHTLAAELLLMHALGRDRAWLYSHPEATLDAASAQKFFGMVSRRAAGTPTQYLTGKQEFWGLEFEVTPAVLIPRPETEHVIEVALERLGSERGKKSLRVADVGTGSGCIAVALARELRHAEILATDISAAALEIARRNAARHGVAERVHFLQGNLLEGVIQLRGGTSRAPRLFDLIASNPPYVARSEEAQLPREVREHEPREALFAGASGAEIYAPLIAQAGELLGPGGKLVLEIGYGALERVRPLLGDSPAWADVRVTNDLAGIPRVISANRA